jgi:hypothetical protein
MPTGLIAKRVLHPTKPDCLSFRPHYCMYITYGYELSVVTPHGTLTEVDQADDDMAPSKKQVLE